jgi:serine/threonine protein kinase
MASTGEFIGRRVGRFTITSHLATGGMAELFIAKQEAVGGFEKDLVLKMLQDRYAQNARVVEMFLDEARLAAKLNHQNIVHVYDVDEADGVRYIAMEYIHGETLTDIIRRSIARQAFLPLEHALHIVAETAAGLAYAHDRRDADGRPTRIVHRDVSPSNILVTYEGLTKIVDFGIARVQDQIREESGMRPGKVSYMAPEQVKGEGADHRSDIFSLGIILYEITVGRRLWRGPAEQVMRRIVEEQIPPPTYVRRDYPPALELIVMKALERRPADRYQSASDLQNELNDFMEEAGLKSGARRLSQYMKDLFAADAVLADDDLPDVRAARTPGIEAIPVAGDEDPGEELDFDRRAPLMMRMEARTDDSGARRATAPIPAPARPGSGPTRGGVGSGRTVTGPIRAPDLPPRPGAGSGRINPPPRAGDDDALPPVPASALGRAGSAVPRPGPGRTATASGSIRAAAAGSLTPIPLLQAASRPPPPPGHVRMAQGSGAMSTSSDVGAVIAAADAHRSAPRPSGQLPTVSPLLVPPGNAGAKQLLWGIVAAVLVAAAVVVFLVTR